MEEIKTLRVDKNTHQTIKNFAKKQGMDIKTYMLHLANYLERTGQDVTENINTAQEVRKFKDQFVAFQKTFEKNKLNPLLREIADIAASERKSRTEIREELGEVQRLMQIVSDKIDKVSERRDAAEILSLHFEAFKKNTFEFYKKLRETITTKLSVYNVPHLTADIEVTLQNYDKIFQDLLSKNF